MINPIPKKIKTVSDFQRQTKPTFDEIEKSKDPVLVMNRGKAVGVFLSPKSYNEMVENYENYIDSRDLDKALKLKDKTFISLDKVMEDFCK